MAILKNRTIIVAEVGVNHNGELDKAFQIVDAAVTAGADAIKFQTFKASALVTQDALKASYQRRKADPKESQFTMLKRLELPHSAHFALIEYCRDKGIGFISTAFEKESLNFLVNELGLTTLKISSGDLTNGPFLLASAMTGCNLIVSTGMATLGEVEMALSVIAYGLTQDSLFIKPSRELFQKAYLRPDVQEILREKVTLLHCTTQYPAAPEEINLNAMSTMKSCFGVNIGYSDHSEGITVAIAAATLGATLIEKHVTLDRALPGPDHLASLEPAELKDMVDAIRTVENVLGNGLKAPVNSEYNIMASVRKSVVASVKINKGDIFSDHNITMKRTGFGVSSIIYWDLLGTESQKDYKVDDLIS